MVMCRLNKHTGAARHIDIKQGPGTTTSAYRSEKETGFATIPPSSLRGRRGMGCEWAAEWTHGDEETAREDKTTTKGMAICFIFICDIS